MIKPEDIAHMAQELQNHDICATEVYYRNVIGRWYYSAFGQTKSWLENNFSNELQDAEGATHERIKNCCYNLQRTKMDLSFSKLGRLINELHHRRVKADYHLEKTVVKNEVFEAELRYTTIINLINELSEKY